MEKIVISAIEFNGMEEQLNMAVEECCELGAAINHFRRGKIDKTALMDEIAQVIWSIEVCKIAFDISNSELEECIDDNIESLKVRINYDNSSNLI